jgi:hypothetical protein
MFSLLPLVDAQTFANLTTLLKPHKQNEQAVRETRRRGKKAQEGNQKCVDE